jgi:hypothetical protein
MKIQAEHLAELQRTIDAVKVRVPVAQYQAEHPEFSAKRVRWDYFHGTGQEGLRFLCDVLYPYMNDEHMDTALKHVVGV